MKNVIAVLRSKNKIFYMGLTSSTLLAVQAIAPVFGYNIADDVSKEILVAIDAILVVFVKVGIVNDTQSFNNKDNG